MLWGFILFPFVWAVSRQIPSKGKEKKPGEATKRWERSGTDKGGGAAAAALVEPTTHPKSSPTGRMGPAAQEPRLSVISEVTVTPSCNSRFQADYYLFYIYISSSIPFSGEVLDPTAAVGNKLQPRCGPVAPS